MQGRSGPRTATISNLSPPRRRAPVISRTSRKTLREGFDADLDGRFRKITWGLNWTFLSATYARAPRPLTGSANNTNDIALQGYPGFDGVITVHPGNRIPLIPKHTGKAFLDFQATSKLGFDLNEVVVSSSYARGNENNAYTADGVYYLGPGVSPGYAGTNFRAHYDLTRHLQLVAQIDNLFNSHYYTAAWVSNTAVTAQGAIQSPAFPHPMKADRAYDGKRTGSERDILLSQRTKEGVGRTKAEILAGQHSPTRAASEPQSS